MYQTQTMDDLNEMAREAPLSKPLQRRLRGFFMATGDTSLRSIWKSLTLRMSPSLQREVAFEMNRGWLRRVKYMSGVSRLFVTEVAEKLASRQYAQSESFGENFHLYVLARGMCSRGTRRLIICNPGCVWGEEHLLLTAWWLLPPNTARSLSFAEVMSLDRESFASVAAHHPEAQEKIRSCYKWYCVTRGVLFAAAEQSRTLKKTAAIDDETLENEHLHHVQRNLRQRRSMSRSFGPDTPVGGSSPLKRNWGVEESPDMGQVLGLRGYEEQGPARPDMDPLALRGPGDQGALGPDQSPVRTEINAQMSTTSTHAADGRFGFGIAADAVASGRMSETVGQQVARLEQQLVAHSRQMEARVDRLEVAIREGFAALAPREGRKPLCLPGVGCAIGSPWES
mmetsp:Transcript_65613/g.150337  ORF Transcript_65613/g.150337 Transcript_65613/m.150337 type:complete len:397 (+) Transcript_65613:2-1192(+)